MPEHKQKSKLARATRWIFLGAMLYFALQIIVPAALVPRQAQALFGVGDVSITVGDIPRQISDAVSKALKTAGDIAFKNVLRSYLNNLAYNIATEIATGDKGQSPFFVTDPKNLLKNAGDAAAGDFLDSIASDWVGQSNCLGYPDSRCKTDSSCQPPVVICPNDISTLRCNESVEAFNQCLASGCQVVTCSKADLAAGTGLCAGDAASLPRGFGFIGAGPAQCVSNFSLCDLSADAQQSALINVQLNILARNSILGGGTTAQVSGRCPLTSIIDNFDSYRQSVRGSGSDPSKQFLVEFSKTFNPNATQLGAYLNILEAGQEAKVEASQATAFAQNLAGEFEPVTSAISGAVKTPASLLRNAATTIFGKSIDQYLVQTGSAVADAVGVFTNTLTSKLIERYLFGLDPATSSGGSGGLASFLGGSSPGVTAAKFLFASLQQTTYSVAGTTDILSSLSSCPNPNDPTPDTCVIDSRFRTAIEQGITVRDAVAQGLIDGSKPFGYDANGLEPSYFNGYPYRSLVILRKYRIIPVGWELAAQYVKNFAGGAYSLNTLLADYDTIGSPFYRLVDPNWVLKSPEVFCRRQGAGEQIVVDTPLRSEDTNNDGTIDTKDAAVSIIQRQSDYCADEQLCLKQNPDGSCAKYGYCLEDENIWRFNGTECNPAFASCQALTRSDGSIVSYLLNTVDTNGCDASNVGCQWYCVSRSSGDGVFTCNAAAPGAIGSGQKIALNGDRQTCSAEGEGCTSLISRKVSGANLLQNSGLELFGQDTAGIGDGIKDSGFPDGFMDFGIGSSASGCGLEAHATSEAFSGFTAARLVSNTADCSGPSFSPLDGGHYFSTYSSALGELPQPNVSNYKERVAGKSFTFSLYAKTASDDADCSLGGGQLGLYSLQLDQTTPLVQNFANIQATDTWTRYTGSFTFDNNVDYNLTYDTVMAVYIRHEAGDACDVIIDNLQLEEGPLTSYKSYEDNPQTFLKLAPSYLGCTGGPNDPFECSRYARACSAGEVGCEAYTSVATGRTINGVISNPATCDPNVPGSCDQCPVTFAGCQAFRELAIDRPPYRPARDPVSLVPSSGQSCPASAVGCEEYTNLEEVAAGGEGKEYYSRVQSCVLDTDAQAQSYYTWEGSNEFGFQLREYFLKMSNVSRDENGDGTVDTGAPCTNVGAEGDPNLGANGWPNCIDNYDIATAGTLPFGDPNIDYPAATCSASVVGLNPDCAEFYDTTGKVFYRLRSRVIYAQADCKSYRNTIDGPGLTYHIIQGQGASCQAAYAGCRAYKGNAGDNVRLIYDADFENGTINPWIGTASYSTEASSAGGHSMQVAFDAAIPNIDTTLGMTNDSQYTISFWARAATSDTPVSVTLNTSPGLIFPGQAFVQTLQWQRFELGPLYVPIGTSLAGVQLAFSTSSPVYIDSIEIREVTENINLIKDSYTSCSGYEGCQEYTDRDGGSHYLKSFSSLCDESRVGCEAMLNTRNTRSPYASSYTVERFIRGDVNNNDRLDPGDVALLAQAASGVGTIEYLRYVPLEVGDVDGSGGNPTATDQSVLESLISSGSLASNPYVNYTETINGDTVTYVVNDPARGCSAAIKGCMALGEPRFDADGNVSNYSTKYVVNDPDDYGDILCQFGEHMCEAFTSAAGSEYYFKNPDTRTCEYKRISGQDSAGWYKAGTEQGAPDCPVSVGICAGGGIDDGKLCNSSDDCQSGFCNRNPNVVSQPTDGWVGTCPASASSCTEYRDPEEVQSENEVVSVNFAANPSFENYETTPNPSFNTDGVVNSALPDIFSGWTNAQTTAGVCSGNATITCNTNRECAPYGGTCDTSSGRRACGMRLLARDDAYAGNIAATAHTFDACNKGIDSGPGGYIYQCVDSVTREQVNGTDPSLINPNTGNPGCRSNANCPASAYCQGDAAYYTWHTINTDGLTDNRSFTASFYARIDPSDASCAQDGTNNFLTYNFVRTIDDRPWPNGNVQYLAEPGNGGANITGAWQRFEFTVNFPSVDPSAWQSDVGSLVQQQAQFQMVLRNPVFGPNSCDIMLDGFQIAETRDSFDYVPYYYLKDTVDTRSCNGLVDREEGCRLFNDTSLSSLPYSTLLSGDGGPPQTCNSSSECDANSVISVNRDRQCSRWLECETSVRQEDANGKVEELCLSRFICEEMDPITGQCTQVGEYENVNQTYDTPTFASKVKNYTGLVLAGLNWDRRCTDDPTVVCTTNNDCVNGACSDPQIYQGSLPVAAMEEVGSISIQGELVDHGDMGDSNYTVNNKLTCVLSSANADGTPIPDASCPGAETYIGANQLPINLLSNKWGARNWQGGSTTVAWTEEGINTGAVPSRNSNLDENNVMLVRTGGNAGAGLANWNGAEYDLGSSALRNEPYYVTFDLRWATPPSADDEVYVQFGYVSPTGAQTEFLQLGVINPSEKWQHFVLGPAIVGETVSGGTANYESVKLQFIHHYAGPGTVPPVEFYLDNISMKPVLQTKEAGEGLTSRTCRLYPQADAPYCTYTDENSITHQGWQGYCLERDPQNAKYCINWWPVDLLRGESNVFSALQQAGYTGRAPLYMCVSNAGNYGEDRNPFDPPNRDGGGRYVYRETDVCVNTEEIFGGLDVCASQGSDQYQTHVVNYGCDDNAFRLATLTYPFSFASCDDLGGNSGDNHIAYRDPTQVMYMEDIEKIEVLFAYDYDSVGNRYNNPAPMITFSAAGVERGDTFGMGTSDGTATLSRQVMNEGQLRCPTSASYDHCIVWRAQSTGCANCWNGFISFADARGDGKYQVIRYGMDRDDSSGDDQEGNVSLFDFYLRDSCEYLVEVVDSSGGNKAWADRLDRNSQYKTAQTEYPYSQLFAPYGSVVAPDTSSCPGVDAFNPATWDNDCGATGQQPLVSSLANNVAVAGTPYSVLRRDSKLPNSGTGTMCVTIPNHTRNGSTCSAVADCCQQGFNTVTGACNETDAQGNLIVPKCLGFTIPSSNITTELAGNADAAHGPAIDILKRLFANAFGIWHYSNFNTGYERTTTSSFTGWQTGYNNMIPCPFISSPAPGRHFRGLYPDDYCGVPPVVSNVLIGAGDQAANATSVNISGGGVVQLSFTITADINQKPIRLIEIDFGDSDGNPSYSTIGNYDSGTVLVSHEYTRPGTYEPRIRVIDNWGWCGVLQGQDCTGADCRDNRGGESDYTPANNPGCSLPGSGNAWINTGITVRS